MSMNTYLEGRLRNTPLSYSYGLLPLFEAVVNSIHAIAEIPKSPKFIGVIEVEIIRSPQTVIQLKSDGSTKRGLQPLPEIIGFKITDNGIGFHENNMLSFETLDSVYKAEQGCRGVGRLLWLKAFSNIEISSIFQNSEGAFKKRIFNFNAKQGIYNLKLSDAKEKDHSQTTVYLNSFGSQYSKQCPKTAKTIATSLLEHCLWYFVRPEGAPQIYIIDELERIDLNDIYEEYMFTSNYKEQINIQDEIFEVTHIRLKTGSAKPHYIAWCAASRVVNEENITSKIPGLHGKIKDPTGDFIYCCFVTSSFLDKHVRPERTTFDIPEHNDGLFSENELNFAKIRETILTSSAGYLSKYLKESRQAGLERVEKFVFQKAPKYRPILNRIPKENLSVDPNISDKDLDLVLHKQLAVIEGELLSEGHEVMRLADNEDLSQYQARLLEYLSKADDIKKSDLANYVFHRKTILDILEKAIQKGADGKYAREELIHEMIMPMRKTSNEVKLDSCNLWLIDERLAFHDFLASDKTLASMPITGCNETKEPDICALNVFDEPLLFSEGQRLPLASIVIVEIKRPMRNDASSGEDKDPIEQVFGYLDRIREGGAKTQGGRIIPRSEEIPGFCYVICDITRSVEKRCRDKGLTVTSDQSGYFGYNANYKAYIEVISFDRLLNAARERNKAFFDRLGLPTN
jgi:hypothetical protein